MLLTGVYVRFYKSFNYDYLRKTHEVVQQRPWEDTPEGFWYPYVRVPIEDGITTVVGANESGKSQLLSAIKCALTGDGIERGDFCRYSQFFVVDRTMRLPDFGVEFGSLSESDLVAVGKGCGIPTPTGIEAVSLFRTGVGPEVVYLKNGSEWTPATVESMAPISEVLPTWFMIDSKIPLPESVPISFLGTGSQDSIWSRRRRQSVLGRLFPNAGSWFASPQTITTQATDIYEAVSDPAPVDIDYDRKLRLADDLLVKVAGIHRTSFEELEAAVLKGEEGYANGIVEKVNEGLANSLNFPKWWTQDSEFRLLVTLRDRDLVVTG